MYVVAKAKMMLAKWFRLPRLSNSVELHTLVKTLAYSVHEWNINLMTWHTPSIPDNGLPRQPPAPCLKSSDCKVSVTMT